MLLLLQAGSVKLGDMVRYTITYTPSSDRILPSPSKLFLRIRNTSTIALRAAFVHGPYSLSVAAYPSTFDPNKKFTQARKYGMSEFEPMVKAGGSWECELTVPEDIRQTAGLGSDGCFGEGPQNSSVTWIVEVASQILFSNSASVGYEVVVARDKKSLNWSYAVAAAAADNIEHSQHLTGGRPGSSHKQSNQVHGLHGYSKSVGSAPTKGVFSRAVQVIVEDTAELWNKPHVAGWSDVGKDRLRLADEVRENRRQALVAAGKLTPDTPAPKFKKKKIHLVILTHGLHSNTGADMLFLKESIDAGAKKARADAKARRAKERQERQQQEAGNSSNSSSSQDDDSNSGQSSRTESPTRKATAMDNFGHYDADEDEYSDDDDEQVIVKGYTGNATRTERGIKFLGKRLARYVLALTYPDQPYHPEINRNNGQNIAHALKVGHGIKADESGKKDGPKADDQASVHSTTSHQNSSIKRDEFQPDLDLPYKITSISLLGHSLGGLIQTYAVAYIQKHSPQFFDLIKPINFVALATPFLGLSNENPMYVKFALDFGLVGRTGQDLGLTWRPPTLARSGWSALVSNLGETAHKKVLGESQPESKPLLRILPTGPAHTALRKFRNRTVYSNVVNDGIVPLRTSCLLFLDWQGLGRVEKARRGAGLVETVVAAGWAELTGTGMNNRIGGVAPPDLDDDEDRDASKQGEKTIQEAGVMSDTESQPPPTPLLGGEGNQHEVPQPPHSAMAEDDRQSLQSVPQRHEAQTDAASAAAAGLPSLFSGFFALFKNYEPPKFQEPSEKQKLIYRRSQTLSLEDGDGSGPSNPASPTMTKGDGQSRVTTGAEFENDALAAPPRTTVFESAHDIINPKMPDVAYLMDPSKRARTIFHDRVYHPEDIPPPPMKKRTAKPRRITRTFSHGKKDSAAFESPISPLNARALTANTESTVHSKDTKDSSPDYQKETSASDTTSIQEAKLELVKDNDDVDSANMRVEEKIARAYHRGLSWRKVLVKLEPDAHNNIIVRRMFPNAYGWPVVHHVVEAHFSDSVTARSRVDEDISRERALDPNMPPNKDGRETRNDSPAPGLVESQNNPRLTLTTDPLALEAADSVPDLPMSPNTGSLHKCSRSNRDPASPMRNSTSSCFSNGEGSSDGEAARRDSMTWSERDWHDSEPDSDSGPLSPGLGIRNEAPTYPPVNMTATGSTSLEVPKGRNILKKNPPGKKENKNGWTTWTDAIVGKRSNKGKGKETGIAVENAVDNNAEVGKENIQEAIA